MEVNARYSVAFRRFSSSRSDLTPTTTRRWNLFSQTTLSLTREMSNSVVSGDALASLAPTTLSVIVDDLYSYSDGMGQIRAPHKVLYLTDSSTLFLRLDHIVILETYLTSELDRASNADSKIKELITFIRDLGERGDNGKLGKIIDELCTSWTVSQKIKRSDLQCVSPLSGTPPLLRCEALRIDLSDKAMYDSKAKSLISLKLEGWDPDDTEHVFISESIKQCAEHCLRTYDLWQKPDRLTHVEWSTVLLKITDDATYRAWCYAERELESVEEQLKNENQALKNAQNPEHTEDYLNMRQARQEAIREWKLDELSQFQPGIGGTHIGVLSRFSTSDPPLRGREKRYIYDYKDISTEYGKTNCDEWVRRR